MSENAEEEIADNKRSRRYDYQQTQGIPFGWALSFFVVLLIAVYIGHKLTVDGQSTQYQYRPVPVAPVAPTTTERKSSDASSEKMNANITQIVDSMQKISTNNSNLTKAVDDKIGSVDTKILSMDKKFEELESLIRETSKSINNLNSKEPSLRLEEINRSLNALSSMKNITTKDDMKNISTKEDLTSMSDKNNKMLNTLNQNIVELALVLKKQKPVEEIKINSSLGEEFPTKK